MSTVEPSTPSEEIRQCPASRPRGRDHALRVGSRRGAVGAPAGAATGDRVLINEFVGSTTGTDVEYIELFGDPDQSLDGLSLIVVESDDQADNGAIDRQIDLTGEQLGANQFFLVGVDAVESTYGVTPDLEIPTNRIEDSSYTLPSSRPPASPATP